MIELATVAENARLTYLARVFERGIPEMLRRANRGQRRRKWTFPRLYSTWEASNLPAIWNIVPNNWKDVYMAIQTYAPRKKKKREWMYHDDFWRERMLARFRAKVLPTRAWAYSMKLHPNPYCCH